LQAVISALTLLRTAAVSALAASLLASPSRSPSVLALAPYLAEAHLAARLGTRTRGSTSRRWMPWTTGSREPVVRGELLCPGAHLDLVGSFMPAMRECNDEAMRRRRVFIDFEAAMEEAGELVGAVQRGVLRRSDVAGTLAELAAGTVEGRRSDDEITVFKSIGTARSISWLRSWPSRPTSLQPRTAELELFADDVLFATTNHVS
ncbi:hypothetical protein BAE44_0009285, partial [Dichanthelium oligosanthes]